METSNTPIRNLKISQISSNIHIISDYVQMRRRLVGHLLELKSKKGLMRISDAIQTLYVKDWAIDETSHDTQVFGPKFEFRIFWTWNGRATWMWRPFFAFDYFCTCTNRLKINIRTAWLSLYGFNLLAEIAFTQPINYPSCSEYEGILLLNGADFFRFTKA